MSSNDTQETGRSGENEGPAAAQDPDILIEKRQCAAVVTLNRPAALHALTDEMRRALAREMPKFSRDPILYAMVIRSTGPKAFCAGGDVRQLVELARADMAAARASFADEYRLNWRLECFSKPTAALIDGVVMGSGVGLTMYNTHRVAGPNYKFAMPETGIGLFPDVGVSHVLARMPKEIGTYLALTGEMIGRADAFALGLVTHCTGAEEFDGIVADLSDAEPIDPVLDRRHRDPGQGTLMQFADDLAEWFQGETVSDILLRLEKASGDETEVGRFAANAADVLRSRAPLSLCVTLAHLRAVRHMDRRETLIADYDLACHFLEDPDFYEGVRAALIDKDKAPKWSPATLADVSAEKVRSYRSEPRGGRLELATRPEMQAARA